MNVTLKHKTGTIIRYPKVQRIAVFDPYGNNFPTIHLTLEDGDFKGYSPFDWSLEILNEEGKS